MNAPPAMTQRRQITFCLASLVAGVITGYTIRLVADKERCYRDVREWRTLDAAGKAYFAFEALGDLRDGNTAAVRTKLEEQLTICTAHLREHYAEFDAKERTAADEALRLIAPQ